MFDHLAGLPTPGRARLTGRIPQRWPGCCDDAHMTTHPPAPFTVHDSDATADAHDDDALGDLAPADLLDPPTATSDLDQLRADMARDVLEEVVLPVPSRPGYESVHVADLPAETINDLRRRCRDKNSPDGINAIKLVASILVITNTAVRKNGQRLVDERGEPLNYRSAEWLEIMGEPSAVRATRKFYGRDGEMTAAANALMTAAGWGESLEVGALDEENPTRPGG